MYVILYYLDATQGPCDTISIVRNVFNYSVLHLCTSPLRPNQDLYTLLNWPASTEVQKQATCQLDS